MEQNQPSIQNNPPKPAQNSKKDLVNGAILAVIGFGLAVWEYFDLTKFETEGGSRRVHSVVKMLYDIGGKWTVVGGCIAMGALGLFLIIKSVKASEETPRVQ